MELDERSLPEIRKKADEYIVDHGWEDLREIAAKNAKYKAFKAETWARKAVATDELPERLELLRQLSRDQDWRVRERVAMALKYVNSKSFERAERAWYDWVQHDDPYVRRACEVGLMGIPPEHVDPALDILDHVISDSNDYVKKSCGGFAVSEIANYDPDVGRRYLDRWSRSDVLRTRWNVAKAIGGAYGRHNDHAIELAYRLSGDEAYRVRRATASSVKKLIEKRSSVREEIEQWDDRGDFRTML